MTEYNVRIGISNNSESAKVETVIRMLEAHPHVTTVTIE